MGADMTNLEDQKPTANNDGKKLSEVASITRSQQQI